MTIHIYMHGRGFMTRYKRVLLKLSGGALAGENGFGFESKYLEHIADELEITTSPYISSILRKKVQ
jgi:uridylate kinase